MSSAPLAASLWDPTHTLHMALPGAERVPGAHPELAKGDTRHMSQLGLLLKSLSYKTQLQQLNTSKTI